MRVFDAVCALFEGREELRSCNTAFVSQSHTTAGAARG